MNGQGKDGGGGREKEIMVEEWLGIGGLSTHPLSDCTPPLPHGPPLPDPLLSPFL